MKKLRIEIELELPEDHWEMSRVMAGMEPLLKEFREKLPKQVRYSEAVVVVRAAKKKAGGNGPMRRQIENVQRQLLEDE